MDAPAVRCVTRMWIFFDKTGRARYREANRPRFRRLRTTNVVVVHAASWKQPSRGSRLLLKLSLKAGLGRPSRDLEAPLTSRMRKRALPRAGA